MVALRADVFCDVIKTAPVSHWIGLPRDSRRAAVSDGWHRVVVLALVAPVDGDFWREWVRLLDCGPMLVAVALLRSQLGQKDVVAALVGDRVAAELRGAAAGSGEIQVALAVRHDRVGVVGPVAARLLEPPQCSGSVVLHDVDIRGRAAAGLGHAVEFDAACERASQKTIPVSVGGDT